MKIKRFLGNASLGFIAVFGTISAQAADRKWKDDASGDWTTAANWVNSTKPGTSDKAIFPATMTGGNVVTIPSGTSISLNNISISKDMTLVMNNGKLTISGDTVTIGNNSPATLEFKGATPLFKLSKGWRYIDLGTAYATTLKFVLPSTPWTDSTAPIQTTGEDAPLRFWLNTYFVFDAGAAKMPNANATVTYVIGKASDGLRTPDDGQASVYSNNLTVVNLPESMLGKLVPDGTLKFVIEGPIIPDGSVVRAGHYGYPTAAEAFAAVKDGEVIQLLQNATIDETFALTEKSVTLNLDGKTLTMSGTDPAIVVGDGAKLTVKGGTINAPNGAAIAQTAGELDISNTTIQSAGDCVAVSGAGTASLTLGGGNSFTSANGAAIRETSEEGAAHAIVIDDGCRLATDEGASIYAGQPSFVAGEAFAGQPVIAGTFSSEIAAKYIPDSSKQKQTDDKWRVSLALDPALNVGAVTIGEDARATFSYELKELGYGQTTATVKADYKVVGASGWTTVEIATVTEEPFAGTGVIEGLVDGTKYAFRIYAVAGDRKSEVTEESGVAVPFSKTTWTGAADDDNWSTAANWIDGHVAFVAQGVTISGDYNDQNTIVLDKDVTLSGLVFGGGAKAKISGGHTLTVNEAADKCMDPYQRLFCGANELTVSGADTVVDVKPVVRLGQSSGVKLVVEDGARFTNNKWVLGDNENYTFIATNSGSSIAMTIVANTWAEAGKKDYFFAAYDGATLTVDGTSTYQGFLDQSSNEPVFLADNATVSVKKIRANGGKPTAISDHGGSLWVGSFTPTVDGARVTCQNGGTFGVYGNLQLSESGKTSTLEILGAGSKISTTSGIGANGQVLLGNGSADKLTVRLAPAADWVTGGARVSSANLVNLKANVKFVIDLANVTADMMKKPMTILSGNGSSSYAIPGKKNVELVNNDNYVVSFVKVGNTLTMTVDYGPGLLLLLK